MGKIRILLLTLSFMLLSVSSCFAWGWGWDYFDDIGDKPMIQYYAHTLENGWSNRAMEGEAAGDPYGSQTIDAIKANVIVGRYNYITYRVHVQDGDWSPWRMNGAAAGTYGTPIDGIQVAMGSWGAPAWSVSYKGRIKDYGWINKWLPEGEILGNLKDPIQSFRIRID